MTSPKYVSPHRLARFYFHECERYLRFSSTPRAEREVEGIPSQSWHVQPVTAAILEGGYIWEEQVVRDHLVGCVRLAPARDDNTPLRDRAMSLEETRNALTTLRAGEFAYQPTLRPPTSFYQRYGLDPSKVVLTDCRPDLVECVEDAEGRLHLRVTDVKASPGVKLSHRVQATVYTMILDHVLEDWDIDDRFVAEDAGIWIPPDATPQIFDVRAMRPPLEQFLREEMQPLLEAPAATARWHLYYRCEWCEYFEHCREEMRATDDVSRVPYLSTHAKRFLSEATPPVRTTHEFREALHIDSFVDSLENCASLRGRTDRVRVQIDALDRNAVEHFGGASLAMPKAEHIRVIVTVQNEPISGQVYAYGIYAQWLQDVLGESRKTLVRVAPAGDTETVSELERDLVRDLTELMTAVHTFNANTTDWLRQKTLQVFAFDTYERNLLIETLVRRLDDPIVAEDALRILFFLQSPELVGAEDHPASEVFFPVVVLSTVIRALLALPVEVTYRFGDVVRLLPPDQHAFTYNDNDFFTFAFSNQLRADAILGVWNHGRKDWLGSVERELRFRLWSSNSLVNGVRERLGASLFAWPPKFALPASLAFRHPILSRLAFLARYESVLDYLGLREGRMAPFQEQLKSRNVVSLRHADGDRFLVDPSQQDVLVEASGFLNFLLVDDSDTGREALLAFDDYGCRTFRFPPKNWAGRLAAVSVREGDEETTTAVRLRLAEGSATPPFRSGGAFLLTERFTDWNVDRAIEELQLLDEEDDPRFVEVLALPVEFNQRIDVPRVLADTARTLAVENGMTASQLAAFDGVVNQRLQLVWGPPGTGKTHFLAVAILCLAEAHRAAGESFQVLVSAFTHAAVDNLLRKTAQLQRRMNIVRASLPLAKLDRITLAEMDEVETVEPSTANAWTERHQIAIAGGTVWSIYKGYEPAAADLVVIDEGSQLKVPEASIAIRRLSDDGRLVIGGDDRQLPPIVLGSYPDPTSGAPLLHRSIFECLRGRESAEQYTTALLENWRSNAVLCRYPAEQVYVPEYKSATDAIAERRMPLLPAPITDQLVEAIIDPSFPLVVGVLEGVRAAAENRVEAALVAACALALRSRLLTEEGVVYSDGAEGDAQFWEHGLFVVSPHHAQIAAIRKALRAGRRWQAPPFVDTVDKMQGQECEAVITSYGVSDPEYALGEKEFIYSLNRLNVSITRARSKTIAFLPRPLIEPPIAAFEDDETAEGIAFMQGLVQYARRNGEESRWQTPEGHDLLLLRVG
jgi:hypothetical protein